MWARHIRRQAGFLARSDVLGPEITLVGDHVDFFDVENLSRRLRRALQQAHVQNIVRHRLFDDHLVLGVDGDLNVVADADLRIGRHGAAVGIGQRHLAFAALLQRGKMRRIFAALLVQRLDLFRQILDARTGSRALLGVAGVEPLEIIFQLLVGGRDEFLQRSRGEVPVLVVDRLDARAVHRQQLAPEQIEPPAQDHELSENLLERGAIDAPEIGDGLEIRF